MRRRWKKAMVMLAIRVIVIITNTHGALSAHRESC